MHSIFSLMLLSAMLVVSAAFPAMSKDVTTRLEISGDKIILSYSDSRDAVIFRREGSSSGYIVPPMKMDIPGKWTLEGSSAGPRRTQPGKNQPSQNILRPGISGHSYSYTFSANGRKGIRWSAKGLPEGLRMSSSGKITGRPKKSGVFSVDITAESRAGREKNTFSLRIFSDSRPEIITRSLPDAKAGESYDFRLKMNDSPAFTLMAEGIPEGLTADNDGRIYGIPKNPGNYTVKMTAASEGGQSSAELPLTVASPDVKRGKAPAVKAETQSRDIHRAAAKTKRGPHISSLSMKQAFTGEPYTFTLKAAGNDKVKWSCDSLPEGLSLNADTGIISGIPASDFRGKITVTAVNKDGQSSRPLTLSIKTRRPKVITLLVPEGFTSEDYFAQIKSEGGNIATWTVRGKIPDGLSFSKTGIISGVPKKAGRFSFTASAENSGGRASRRFTLRISENTPHEYVTAAVIPAFVMSADGVYDFPVSIDENIPDGSYIEWHSFPYGIEAETENYTFKNSEGREIFTVPKNHRLTANVYLEGGVRYEPVITARVKTQAAQPPKQEALPAQQGTYSGCNISGVMSMIIFTYTIKKRGRKS